MPLSTYAELQSAITNESWDPDWTEDDVRDFIARAEAMFNRKIKAVEVNAPLTGVSGSRFIDTSALSMVSPKKLWITDNGDEREVTLKTQENLTYLDDRARPSKWAYDEANDQIVFDTVLDEDYTARLLFVQKYKLSNAAPTNWLLETAPDLYLNACVAEGLRFMRDYQAAAGYDMLVKEGVRSVRKVIGDRKRGELITPPDLMALARGGNRYSVDLNA